MHVQFMFYLQYHYLSNKTTIKPLSPVVDIPKSENFRIIDALFEMVSQKKRKIVNQRTILGTCDNTCASFYPLDFVD